MVEDGRDLPVVDQSGDRAQDLSMVDLARAG
jgi:hypothetical protein